MPPKGSSPSVGLRSDTFLNLSETGLYIGNTVVYALSVALHLSEHIATRCLDGSLRRFFIRRFVSPSWVTVLRVTVRGHRRSAVSLQGE